MSQSNVILLLVILVIAVVVVACGGGNSSSSNTPAPTPTPVTRTDKVEHGYFGQFDGQNVDTVDHVSFAFSMDWGDWSTPGIEPFVSLRIINELQDAKARGITKAIVAVGYLTWNGNYETKGTDFLNTFKTQLDALGLYDMIIALYPIDEPDQAPITEANLEAGLTAIHQVFPDKKLMVIYGDHGRPAQQFYDYVGEDKYGHGLITVPLLPNQRMVLVKGGADPYKEDPTDAVDYALTHPEVAVVVFFLYGDYTGGKGIKNNGMLPIYRQQGQRLQ